ncbi:hypothetical protein QVD17_02468 [Tagetes erecta]|uniref:Uncharacterized protein n=1 Tax=Tagetes erecta TaxID=13708 RepID=A0AAD8LCH2_TARER|nr:hypothetical protein QVD17_02468 [Tagetes erecta]
MIDVMRSFQLLLALIHFPATYIYTYTKTHTIKHHSNFSFSPTTTTTSAVVEAPSNTFPTTTSSKQTETKHKNNMGNCQAIDNASLVIQHPNGKIERFYSDVSAAEVMKLNPGHYVALLLTTVLYSSRHPSTSKRSNSGAGITTAQPLRVTKIKLLRHTESLTVGHIYRLITTQEAMKGLMAKKNGKTINNNPCKESTGKHEICNDQPERTHRLNNNRRRINSQATAIKGRGWHPSLNSISEASN